MDEANRRIGLVRRADVFAQRANFRTVHILVTNEAGLLLLQQLSPTRDRHPGQWGSSVAGYLFAGESYEAAATRRLREELDVESELTSCGIVPVDDAGVTKFVGVFSCSAERPRIADSEHIASIEFRRVADIDADIAARPSTYTDTFVHIFGYWRQNRSLE